MGAILKGLWTRGGSSFFGLPSLLPLGMVWLVFGWCYLNKEILVLWTTGSLRERYTLSTLYTTIWKQAILMVKNENA